ncbi:MAG: GNAT family protein [Moraxellaceae bacterium]|nr:GNAT family protein [Moraxellaceae bacterium]
MKLSLIGRKTSLHAMREAHAEALVAAAADGGLWNLPLTNVPDAARIDDYIAIALADPERTLPFVTTLADEGQIVGTTRFWKIDRVNRKLEIGHTWIAESWQRSHVNTEAKYLMLRFAFEELGCLRVQFQTDELNERSRAAILRIGATQEGILRSDRIVRDGRRRNSVRFSIIDDEWPACRQGLEERLRRGGIQPHFEVAQT